MNISIFLAAGFAVQAQAETEPTPFPDFTFKRVAVPPTGAKRLIIQIDPAEQAAALAPRVSAKTTPSVDTAVTGIAKLLSLRDRVSRLV